MKRAITTCICALMLGGPAMAQSYQIPNSDFEIWNDANEPGNGWYSFVSAGGGAASLGKLFAKGNTTKIEGRTGAGIQIISKSIIGKKANGNLTTGRINMGSTTPDDPSNYNFTDKDKNSNNCPFVGLPDSVSCWAKFSRGESGEYPAQGNFVLHGDIAYKDPHESDANVSAYRVGGGTIAIAPCEDWIYFSAPMEYTGVEAEKMYMLGSFTTNPTPGGSANDKLQIDDVKFIYNSRLASLSINGAPLKGFNKDVYSYTIQGRFPTRNDIVAVSDGKGATVDVQEDVDDIKIIITGNDSAENQHTYVLKPSSQITGSFEAWEDCQVWDGVKQEPAVVGKQPQGWTASNVSQMGVPGEFVTLDIAGRNGSAPKITNKFVGAMGIGANAPAFISLGKMWVFPDVMGMIASMQPDDFPDAKDLSDGGVVGGTAFTSRPDSLTVYYKRTLGEEKPNEPAKVLIYLWKGSFKSKIIVDHPMTEDQSGFLEPVYEDTIDQDRVVLGREKPEGGDGVLIGSAEYTIEGACDEWTRLSIPITYLTEDTPEKMNVVFSAGNYWVRSEIGADNTLWVDDAALVYNAQLKSLTLGGTSIAGFASDVYNYSLPYADASKELKAVAFGKNAEVSITDKENTASKVVKEITVTDNTTQDATKTYVYTITFQGQQAVINVPTATHEYVYGDAVALNFTSNNPAEFVYEISDENVVKYDASAKTFKMVGAGSVTVTAKQLADDDFAFAVSEPFEVNVAKAKLVVSFKEGTAWCRRGQTFSWLRNPEDRKKQNEGDAEFLVEGLKNEDDLAAAMGDCYIRVEAPTGENEVVGEYRAATLELGGGEGDETAHYKVEFLTDQKMLIKKTKVKVAAIYAGKYIWASAGSNAKEIIIPVGEDAGCIRPYYQGFLSGENDTVLGSSLPVFQCPDITKESPAGTTSALTVTLPDESTFPNHELVSDLTEGGVVKTALAPDFSVAEKNIDAVYGDKVKLTVTKGEGVEYDINRTYYTTMIDVDNVTVSMTKTGKEKLIVYVRPTGELAGKEVLVNINIAKAPFTVKAKNVELPLGEEAPKTFAFELTGFVNEDDSAKVFTTAPSAVLEAEIPSDAKVGDTFPIIVTPGQSANYELTAENGTLTLIVGTGIQNKALPDVCAYSKNGAIYVANKEALDPVRVYTVQGVKVYEGTDDVITTNIERNTMYVVRVGSYVAKVSVK